MFNCLDNYIDNYIYSRFGSLNIMKLNCWTCTALTFLYHLFFWWGLRLTSFTIFRFRGIVNLYAIINDQLFGMHRTKIIQPLFWNWVSFLSVSKKKSDDQINSKALTFYLAQKLCSIQQKFYLVQKPCTIHRLHKYIPHTFTIWKLFELETIKHFVKLRLYS